MGPVYVIYTWYRLVKEIDIVPLKIIGLIPLKLSARESNLQCSVKSYWPLKVIYNVPLKIIDP